MVVEYLADAALACLKQVMTGDGFSRDHLALTI